MLLPEGIHIRRPTMDDISSVFSLMLAQDKAEYGEANMTEEHIRTFWQAPDCMMATDAWAVTTAYEKMIGYLYHIPQWLCQSTSRKRTRLAPSRAAERVFTLLTCV